MSDMCMEVENFSGNLSEKDALTEKKKDSKDLGNNIVILEIVNAVM